MATTSKSAYATFVGVITQESVARAINHINGATQGGYSDVHILFQSLAGVVGDGLALYSYLRALPIQLHMYNGGTVESIAVISYLGAQNRYVSDYSTFLLHPSRDRTTGIDITAEAHAERAKSLAIDDQRTKAIIRGTTALAPARYEQGDRTLTAQEAINLGIADGFRDFKVPAGHQIFDLTTKIV